MTNVFKRGVSFFIAIMILLGQTGCGNSSDEKESANAKPLFEATETLEPIEEPSLQVSTEQENTDQPSPDQIITEESSGEDKMTENQQTISEKILAEMLANMSIQDKLTTMMIPAMNCWRDGTGSKAVTTLNEEQESFLQKYHFGGLILFEDSIDTNEQTYKLIKSLQKANSEGGAGTALFIAVDQEGGAVTRLSKGTQLVGNMALGATGDTEMSRLSAQIIGKELKTLGFNVNFAPALDVNNNPDNPIIGVRSFSDDPGIVAEHGEKYVEGLHEEGVIACLKHFPGHGDTHVDSHKGFPRIDKTYEELRNFELYPFAEVIKAGADMIMTAHIQYPMVETGTYTSISGGNEVYLPATLSKTFLTDILRGELYFDGVIVTDGLNMDAIAKNFDPVDVAKLCINAGGNMLLLPARLESSSDLRDFDKYIDKLVELTLAGEIDEEKINDSVLRILKLKLKYGLIYDDKEQSFEVIATDIDLVNQVVGSYEHHEKEWEIAKKCITLVKNVDGVLPLKNPNQVLIACPDASLVNSASYIEDVMRKEGIISGTVEISIVDYSKIDAGSLKSASNGKDAVIVLSSVESRNELDPSTKRGAKSAKIDVLCNNAKENGGSSIIISCGLPYDLGRYNADALLSCYNNSGMREKPTDYSKDTLKYGPNVPAAIYTVFGGNNPEGRLPVNVPGIKEDYSFDRDYVYDRGFGISY